MASKVFEQICDFLDKKGLNYGKDDSNGVEKISFGVKSLVKQQLLFFIEAEADVVQFRSVHILDEKDLENYHNKPKNREKLHEFLLRRNYELKLGKYSLDPDDEDVDLYFVVADYVEIDKGIEEDFMDRVYTIFTGSPIDHGIVEKDIKHIKSILDTGEKDSTVSEDDPSSKFKALLSALKEDEKNDSSKEDEWDDGI